MAISNSDKKARLYKCVDGYRTTLATASSAYTLSNGTTYNAKVTVDDDPLNSALQRFRFQVDTNANGFGDDTYFDSTAVDDDASVSIGYAGLAILGVSTAATHQFDDVVISDNSSNVQVSDDFNTNIITLSYDNNGNLTDDGIFKFVYDAWNRLVTAKRAHGSNATIGAYAYDGATRRTKKVVTNQGAELVANDGGNQTVNFYYGSSSGGGTISPDQTLGFSGQPWSIFETRNGSNQTTFVYNWGQRYIDELVFFEKNGDPTTGNDSTPDVTGGGEGGESPADKRYYAVQDRNWNVMALTEYVVGGGGSNGRIAERYSYTPYGESAVLKGDGGSGEIAKTVGGSSIGAISGHQGLHADREIGSYQNRYRQHASGLARFVQRDPLDYHADVNPYACSAFSPTSALDPSGLLKWWEWIPVVKTVGHWMQRRDGVPGSRPTDYAKCAPTAAACQEDCVEAMLRCNTCVAGKAAGYLGNVAGGAGNLVLDTLEVLAGGAAVVTAGLSVGGIIGGVLAADGIVDIAISAGMGSDVRSGAGQAKSKYCKCPGSDCDNGDPN